MSARYDKALEIYLHLKEGVCEEERCENHIVLAWGDVKIFFKSEETSISDCNQWNQ
jgi:hypothetical protein